MMREKCGELLGGATVSGTRLPIIVMWLPGVLLLSFVSSPAESYGTEDRKCAELTSDARAGLKPPEKAALVLCRKSNPRKPANPRCSPR
jgi:hypothetical protein